MDVAAGAIVLDGIKERARLKSDVDRNAASPGIFPDIY
jgi:hypothetical protein